MSKRMLICAATMIVLVACGSGRPPVVARAASGTDLGAGIVRDVKYSGANVRLTAAPVTAAPVITAAQALQAYVKSGVFPRIGATPDVRLVSFSDDVRGQIQPDGTVKLDFQNVLAWAVVFHAVPYSGVGTPAGVDNKPVPEDIAIIIDAQTGKMLEAFADVAD